ncbi:MAG: hypothetical protein OHK0018_10320 [Erythrobacter tepidarius]
MRTRTIILLTLCAAAIAALGSGISFAQDRKDSIPRGSAPPPSGGMLGTLQRGEWECALPGDAGAEAYVVVPEEGFRIGNASSYRTADGGRGIYLLRGTGLVFTRGPKKDERFELLGENTLRKLAADGSPSKLICTRLGSNR